MDINKIINVRINNEAKPLGQKGFNTLLILGANATFTGRAKLFGESELSDLKDELTGGVNAIEYVHASAAFANNEAHVDSVVIGKFVSGDTGYDDTLDEIVKEYNDFFGVTLSIRTLAEQKKVADWCQANDRVCVLATAEANVVGETVDVDVTSIGWYVKSKALSNTTVVYHEQAVTDGIDSGILGYLLALTPGSYTGAHKTITGATVNKLSAGQSKNAHDKFVSTYEPLYDRNILTFTKTGSGEFLDVIIFVYWLIARIQENNILLLMNSLKVPMANNGIVKHENATREILELGITNGGITDPLFDATGKQIGGYWTSFPGQDTVPTADKIARYLSNCKFKFWISGAIHTMSIEGVLAA